MVNFVRTVAPSSGDRPYSTLVSIDGERFIVAEKLNPGDSLGDVSLTRFNLSGTSFQTSIFDTRANARFVGPTALSSSADQQQGYFAVDNRLQVFSLTDGGTPDVFFTDGLEGVDGLSGANSVAASADGKQVFVAGFNDNALAVFNRNPNSGELSFSTFFKDGVDGVNGLAGATMVAVSPDGKQVFVTGGKDNALAVFDRRPGTGDLIFNTFFKDGVDGVDGLAGATAVTTSPNGRSVFVTGQRDNALTVFDRDPASGVLTLKSVFKDNREGIEGLAGASAVTTNTSGSQVFVTGFRDDALVVFNQDAASGELSFDQVFKDGVEGVDGLNGAAAVIFSEQKQQVIVAGNLDRELAIFDTQSSGGSSGVPRGNGNLTPTADNSVLKVNRLAGKNSISLKPDLAGDSGASEILVFRVDEEGNDRTQIGSFSLLEEDQLPTSYAPKLTLEADEITPGTTLQFERVQGSRAQIATVTVKGADEISLDFGDDVQLSATLDNQTNGTNFLVEDAAAIDLSTASNQANIRFTVYREAGYDNTVGLYTMDNAAGQITDTITGRVLLPGDEGYKEAAIANRIELDLTGQNGRANTSEIVRPNSDFLGTFLIVDGSDPFDSDVYFGHAGANSGGDDHAKLLGNNTFGFEDLAGLGDRDFNDVVVQFQIV